MEKETSGQVDTNPVDTSTENPKTGNDSVAYSTHKKLLGEKKQLNQKDTRSGCLFAILEIGGDHFPDRTAVVNTKEQNQQSKPKQPPD